MQGFANPSRAGGVDHSDLHSRTPMVEIEVVHQHGPAPRTERPLRTVEVWTRNRIYTVDPMMTCVEVTHRLDSIRDPQHPFLGSKLVGGQHREGDVIQLSYPYPRPGTEAVFEHPGGKMGGFSRTSTVMRVVLRLHIITVAPTSVAPTWAELTGSHRVAEFLGTTGDPEKTYVDE